MIPTLVISISTFVLITISILLFPKIKIGKISISTYWVIALLGASLLLICNLVPIEEVYRELTLPTSINPLKILILFFSMTLLSTLLDEFGLFELLASKVAKKAKDNQYVLFFLLYLLVAILTVFTSNDVVILTFTPFIICFCKKCNISPIPYLIAEFISANTYSLMLMIGNPTNIFLASSANISFVDYFKTMAVPTLVAGLIEISLLFLIFKKKLKEKIVIQESNITKNIEDKSLLILGVIILITTLIFLVISNYIHIEMWIISLSGSLLLLLVTLIYFLYKKKGIKYVTSSLIRLPYPLIPFFLSMFVIVVSFSYQGISKEIMNILNTSEPIWVYGYSSLLMSNVINNIPMSILYSSLCNGPYYYQEIYASIIGSNIGAFLTPMGALAGIMFINLLSKYDVKLSFISFMKYGFVIGIPTITVALLMLYIM